jgi:hypothetical protein
METEQNKAPTYELSDSETAHMQALTAQVATLKTQIYDLNSQIEKAKVNVEHAQHLVDGALSVMAAAHGFKQAQLSPDLKILTAMVP